MPVTLISNSFSVDQGEVAIIDSSNFDMTSSTGVLGDSDQFVIFQFQGFEGGAITGGYFYIESAPGSPITSIAKDKMYQGSTELRFKDDGSGVIPVIEANANVLDSGGTYRDSGYFPVNVTFDPSLTFENHGATLKTSQTLPLTPAHLIIQDLDAFDNITPESAIEIRITEISHLRLERETTPASNTWVSIQQFDQSPDTFTMEEVRNGLIRLISLATGNPTLTLTARNSLMNSTLTEQQITVNHLTTTPWNLPQGGTLDLTSAHLNVNNPGTWTPSAGATGVQYEYRAAPSIAITSFTKADIDSNLILVRHTGGVVSASLGFVDIDNLAPVGGSISPSVDMINAPILETADTPLNLEQGVNKILSGADITASDTYNAIGSPPADITLVLQITNAQFQKRSSTAAAWGSSVSTITVTQAQINGGLLQVVPDGGNIKPEITVTSLSNAVGAITTAPLGQTTAMNVEPVIAGSLQVPVDQGGVADLSAAVMNINDDNPSQIVIGLAVDRGHFEIDAVDVGPATQCTVTQWYANQVKYASDDTAQPIDMSYTITDGGIELPSQPFVTLLRLKPVLVPHGLGTINDGTPVVLTTAQLSATHNNAAADGSDLIFTPSNVQYSSLYKNGALMDIVAGNSFTLKDIQDGLIELRPDGSGTAPTVDMTVCFEGLCADIDTLTSSAFVVAPSVDIGNRTPFAATQGGDVLLQPENFGTITPPAGVELAEVEIALSEQIGVQARKADALVTVFTIGDLRNGLIQLKVTGDPVSFDYTVQLPGGTARSAPLSISSTDSSFDLNHSPELISDATPLSVEVNKALDQSIVFDSARVIDIDAGDDLWICQVIPSSGPTNGVTVTPYNGSFPGSSEPLAPYISFSGKATESGTALWDVSVCDPKGGQLVFRTGLDVASGSTAPVTYWYDNPALKIVPPVFTVIVIPTLLKFKWELKWFSHPLANAVRKRLSLHFGGRLADDPEAGDAEKFVEFIDVIKDHLSGYYDDFAQLLQREAERIRSTNLCARFFSPIKCSESEDERRIYLFAGHLVDAIKDAAQQRGAVFGITPKGRCDSIWRMHFCSSVNKIKNSSALLLSAQLIAQNAYTNYIAQDGNTDDVEMVHNASLGGEGVLAPAHADVASNPVHAADLLALRAEGQPLPEDDDQPGLPDLPPLPPEDEDAAAYRR